MKLDTRTREIVPMAVSGMLGEKNQMGYVLVGKFAKKRRSWGNNKVRRKHYAETLSQIPLQQSDDLPLLR